MSSPGRPYYYYYQIEAQLRNNIGDVLQGTVAKQFLPPDSHVADRENLADIPTDHDSMLIANGWYLHRPEGFPPPDSVTPLYISVHIADANLLRRRDVRAHFRRFSPIGCRDHKTVRLFLGWGIPAYYSGCLTVTCQRRAEVKGARADECLLVDNSDHPIPDGVKTKLEALLGERLTRVSHDPPDCKGPLSAYHAVASAHAERLLERYCRARIVITTKLHCALPSIGMGCNVLFIHPDPSDPRLDPLRELTKVISFRALLSATRLPAVTLRRRKLRRRQRFLTELVTEAVTLGANPVAVSPRYRLLKFSAVLASSLSGRAVRLLLALGLAPRQLQRVYGSLSPDPSPGGGN